MHPIKRAFFAVILSLGAIGGFTHGFASLAHGGCGMQRREAFEDHVADICTRSAERVYRDHQGPPPPPPGGQWMQPQWGPPPQWAQPQYAPQPQYAAPQYAAPQYVQPAPVAPQAIAPQEQVAPAARDAVTP